jgi:protein-S-isoprenylcysteine O-methyltransferase Ste14
VALGVFLAVWILDSFVFRVSTFLAKHVGLVVRLGASGLVMALAVYFMRGGHRAASPEARSSPGLIDDGAFARVRHPLYAGSLLFYGSLVIATCSLISLAVLAGIFLFYDIIASYEERRLVEAFGSAYEAYRARIPKWVPRPKKTAAK